MLIQDLAYALRGLSRSPAFALAAILSLALGIGANTVVFSVASALLLHPLPYADAERLVILWNRSPGLNIAEDWFSTAQYFDIKNGHRGFEQVAIAIGANYNLTGEGEPERIGVIRVSSNLDLRSRRRLSSLPWRLTPTVSGLSSPRASGTGPASAFRCAAEG